jgi:hypothetical protein
MHNKKKRIYSFPSPCLRKIEVVKLSFMKNLALLIQGFASKGNPSTGYISESGNSR